MHVRCPHCENPIEIVDESTTVPVTCPSCGSNVSLLDADQTKSYRQKSVELLNRFEFLEHLGNGQFGDVWLARDKTLDRLVALKVPRARSFDDVDREMFMREARAAAQLQHPNIVRVYDIGETGGVVFIASEFIRGPNLKAWLKDVRPSPAESARLCATLADALEHAHNAGVIHRDLKPANVLMDNDAQPHLTDFGLAKRDAGEITMTLDGRILGTPAYMPPEQASGNAHTADRRSDVYSLGVVLFEMLTGELPFKSSSRMLLLQQIMTKQPPSPRQINKTIPIDLQTICLKALSKEPERRFQSAKDMADDLRRYLDGRPIVARPMGNFEKLFRWAKRNPLVASLSFAIGLLLATLSFVVFRPTEQPEPSVVRPFTRVVELETKPSGAEVVFVPIDRKSFRPDPNHMIKAGRSPIMLELVPGDYLVVADYRGEKFHEVRRRVPDSEEVASVYPHHFWKSREGSANVQLEPIQLFPNDLAEQDEMGLFQGGNPFVIGRTEPDGDTPKHSLAIPPFYLDAREFSVAQFAKTPDGEDRTWPSEFGNQHPPPEFAMTYLSYDRALAIAESVGKRLPDEAEYEFAATNGGRTAFPWGDALEPIPEWNVGPVDSFPKDAVTSSNGRTVFNLYSNVVEWADNLYSPYPGFAFPAMVESLRNGDHAVIRGGPFAVAMKTKVNAEDCLGPRDRCIETRAKSHPGLGCRFARSPRPRLTAEQFIRPSNVH